MNRVQPDDDRAAGPRWKPCPYGPSSIVKEQTLGAYPRREARGPCPSRTGRVKVVRPAERHRCLFVAFRSAKVATDPRYFRGAKGDNSSPTYRRPSWDCANRATVDRCQRGFGRSEAPEGVPTYPAHSVCRFLPAAHGVCRILRCDRNPTSKGAVCLPAAARQDRRRSLRGNAFAKGRDFRRDGHVAPPSRSEERQSGATFAERKATMGVCFPGAKRCNSLCPHESRCANRQFAGP